MMEITAEEKDKVLNWFYEADINGKELPPESLPENELEICAILTNDGYITNGRYRSVLTLKGQSFKLNGGYVKEKENRERPIKIAEEANRKASYANILSFLAIVVSVASIIFTHHTNTDATQITKGTEIITTDSTRDTTIVIIPKN